MNFIRDLATYAVAAFLILFTVAFCGVFNLSIGQVDRELCTLLQTVWVFSAGMLSMYGLAGLYDFSDENVVAQSE